MASPTKPLDLPKPAIDHFNQVCRELRLLVTPISRQPLPPRDSSWKHRPNITSIDGASARFGPTLERDEFSRLVGIAHTVGEQRLALGPEPSARLERLSWEIAGRKEYRSLVSPKFVLQSLIRWLFESGSAGGTAWDDFFKVEAERRIARYTIAIPLEGLVLERAFRLGHVEFRFFTSQDIAELTGKKDDAELNDDERNLVSDLREMLQGRVHAIVEVDGEPIAANEQAVYHTEQALDLLRFLCPASLIPSKQCFIARKNTVDRNGESYRVIKDGRIQELVDGIDPDNAGLDVGSEFFATCNEALTRFSEVVTRDKRSELEDAALNAMSIFGRGVMARKLEQRLLYALVSMEALLLKDDKESIGSNLSLRVAHLIGKTLEDRKSIVAALKAGYQLRSRFVHHGHPPTDNDAATRVLACAKSVIVHALNERMILTPAALISEIDDKILS